MMAYITECLTNECWGQLILLQINIIVGSFSAQCSNLKCAKGKAGEVLKEKKLAW